ncbi:hypothetical protein PTNB85_06331 [Pyrenophora teres f. teres]|uniref:Uncharacterized protein n=1 Tax=Pyrenophora teres f. teres TaxID=97479 RepID=A0A6S6W7C5_9PLEO|nr:hypothetical protein HRS9139_09009 [Pyrenophora teres f. teres]KAE8834998.1 hypothetical protein PTNB85_06331 [Pyrenophora teres f. teres]KAE8861287.1 hypothetical protein PTNB29_06382 [Pyrenophora teres f. teres]CAE7192997.1 hypothetical protein PTTW11_07664 [Pyrenophora teres f. teres]
MDNYRHISAGSQYDFDTSMGSDYEAQEIIYPEWQYPQNQLHQSMDFGRIPTDNYEQYPHQWPANKLEHQSFSHPRHLSGSSFASTVSSQRSSNYSTFSTPPRNSISSSISTWSNTSNIPHDLQQIYTNHLLDNAPSTRTSCNRMDSRVILSLLHRPDVYYEWMSLLRSSQPRITNCSWNQHSTGRVEGYPESNPKPQLQDYLEYFSPDQDAAALAQMAFDKMVKTTAPPPVPPKDYRNTSLQNLTRQTESWTQFINSVVEDDISPTGVCHIDSW